jgi:hypothetical protein
VTALNDAVEDQPEASGIIANGAPSVERSDDSAVIKLAR